MKIIITEQQYNNAIDKFITYQLEPHKEKISLNHPESIFWVRDKEIIAELDEKFKEFNVDYSIWTSIARMFSFNDYQIQSVISKWLEKHYNLQKYTINDAYTSYNQIFNSLYL